MTKDKKYGDITTAEREFILKWADENRDKVTRAGVICFCRDKHFSNRSDKDAEKAFKEKVAEVYPLLFPEKI